MTNKNVGELLKEHRKDKLGVSVREAALLVGVHYTYLSRIENGISEPSDEVLDKIAKKYKLSQEETTELFVSVKMTPSFEAALKGLKEERAMELMFRKKKK